MRTNIEINEQLLRRALRLSGAKTKRAVVDEALSELVRQKELRKAFRRIRGTGWKGNLDEMRKVRSF